MKKILLLIVASLFIYSGAFAVESVVEKNKENKEQIENSLDNAGKQIIQAKKLNKKELRKFRKENRKEFKDRKNIKEVLSNMLMVGGIIMLAGLLLFLIVTNATWLGIAVMVVGLVLLLYGALQKFF